MSKTNKHGSDSEEEILESEEEETDEESAEEESEDEESEEDESDEEESEDEDESTRSTKKEELDLDAELEKERKAGEPDLTKAEKAFKKRTEKRSDEHGEDDKPLTRADLDAFEAKIRKDADQERALELARELAGSDKEAELIVAKWSNRTFPKNLTLREQMQEAYVITHHKKLIGERNEALRGLKGKQGVKKDSAATFRDAPKGSAPKLSTADAGALAASGFKYNNVTRQYEKKLPNGRMLIRDNKTKQVRLLKK